MFLSVKRILKRIRMYIIPITVLLAVCASIISFAIFSESDSNEVSTDMIEVSEPTREIIAAMQVTEEGTEELAVFPTTTLLTTTLPATTKPETTTELEPDIPTTKPQTTQPPTTEIPEIEYEEEVEEEEEDQDQDYYSGSGGTYLGYYTLTAYCPCSSCSGPWGRQTSYGYTCTSGRTVACNSIAPGTWIYIEGYGKFRVEDTGGGLGSGTIDIFFDEHWQTEEFGLRSAAVYLLD